MPDENPFRRLLGDGIQRTALARDFVAMVARRGEMASYVVVSYRCPKRCLLAQILFTRHGLIVHRSRYKISPNLNAESSTAGGRAKYTEDGDRRWRPETFFLTDAANLTLDCDHLHSALVEVDQVEGDAAARRGDVIVGV